MDGRSAPHASAMSRSYGHDAASCGAARRDAREFLSDLVADPDTTDDVLLIVTELASNAIDHAGTDFTMHLSLADGELVISVRDGSLAPPVPQHPDPHSRRGRGLLLIEALAQRWWTIAEDDGKTVRVVVSVDPVG